MNCCRCLQTIINKFTNKPAPAYNPHRQIQQEYFIDSHVQQSFQDTIQVQPKKINQSIPQQLPSYQDDQYEPQNKQSNLLDIKMELTSTAPAPAPANTQVKHQKNIEDLIMEQLRIAPQLVILKTQQTELLSLGQNDDQINFKSFSINIDPLDPYFSLLHDKTSRLAELFSKSGQQLQLGFPNRTNLQIDLLQNLKLNSFVFKYKLKCSYSFYLSMNKNDKLQQSFSQLISESKVLEAYRPNLTRNTLKFKRIGSFEARDCYYIKYQNGSKKQHWEIYLNDEKGEQSSAYKTCEIFCVRNIRERNNKELMITQYVEVDLQSMSVGNILPKLGLELRNYLNNLEAYVEKNYEQELV